MVKYRLLESVMRGGELARKRRELMTEFREKFINPIEEGNNPESKYYKRSMEVLSRVYNTNLGELIGSFIDKWLNREEEKKNFCYIRKFYN